MLIKTILNKKYNYDVMMLIVRLYQDEQQGVLSKIVPKCSSFCLNQVDVTNKLASFLNMYRLLH